MSSHTLYTGVQGIQGTTGCSGAGRYGNARQLKWSWNDVIFAHAKIEGSLAGGHCGYENIANDVFMCLSHEECKHIYIPSSSVREALEHTARPQTCSSGEKVPM